MACTIDSRDLDEGFGGESYKRKREQAQAIEDAKINGVSSMEIDDAIPPPAKRSAISSSSSSYPDSSVFSKPVRQQPASVEGTTLGKRRIKTANLARIRQLNEARLREAEYKKWREEEKEKKGKEKILRSGTKSETNSKPKILKKISKSKKISESIQNRFCFHLMKLSF